MDDGELVRSIVHGYDPAKRREYYLRTRKLKGRKPGARQDLRGRVTAKPRLNRAQRQAKRTRELEAKVNALKARLEKLRAVLAQLTKEAQARSGHKSNKATPKKTTSDKKSSAPKQTASQKAKAAKRSKEYYEKNRDKILAEEAKSLIGKIKTIQQRIEKMRKDGSIGVRRSTSR